MALNGSDLYDKIEPLIKQQSIDGITFLSQVALEISKYVTSEGQISGIYKGVTPPPANIPVIYPCVANFIPTSTLFDTPEPLNLFIWLKNSLNKTLKWNWIGVIPVTLNPTPLEFIPNTDIIDLSFPTPYILKDILSAEGIWAIICDIIIASILSSDNYIKIVSAKGNIDNSTGNITWISNIITSIKHNFIINLDFSTLSKSKIENILLRYKNIEFNIETQQYYISLSNKQYIDAIVLYDNIKLDLNDYIVGLFKEQNNKQIFLFK